MQPKLQAKHSNIRTYIGQGIEDPSSVIHFDFTPLGFHAIIISSKRATVYINPITTAKQLYAVFDRSNVTQEKQVFDCKTDKAFNSLVQGVEKSATVSDGKLRTYRFAVSTGGEFSQLCLNGTETTDAQKKESVLSVLVTDLIRTNAIFETDFGIHLSYVDDEDTIIFLDGKTDPYTSNQFAFFTGRWNPQSQKAIDSLIGPANYDIGHLLMGYPTGGNAYAIGSACNNKNKGSGVTGFSEDLTTDPFIVDFWDHEIGHQFGGNHTFDYSYEGTGAQMEPGSASTIMGYAGVTGATDIQPHSDPYFHAVSIQQIDAYITTGTGGTCPVITSTGDYVPVASGGSDFVIPKSTPFSLTAASTDNDALDSVTYCWEQFDNFIKNTSNKYPASTSTTGPVFRSLNPTVSNVRTFPALNSILDGTNGNKWEVLPSVSRALDFRLTVRDNHPGGGSTSSDDVVINVDGNSGPFTVTSPNTNVNWKAGSRQTITWNVANTNVAPVNCTQVKILLSTNGGQTFTILKTVSNTGTAKVTLPNITTANARIEILAANNIFFDISNADFTISPSSLAAVESGAIANASNRASVQPNPAKDYTNILFNASSDKCSIILNNEDGKIIYIKTLNTVSKGTSEKISLAGLSKGTYFLKISTDSGSQVEKILVN